MNLDEKIVDIFIRYECAMGRRADSKYIGEPIKRVRRAVTSIIKHLCFAHERKRILEAIESLDYYLGVEVGEDRFGVIRHNEMGNSVLIEDIHRLLEGK